MVRTDSDRLQPPYVDFRYFVKEMQETQVSQVELFLNSVPILSPLTREERARLVDALEEVTFNPGSKVGSVAVKCDSGMATDWQWEGTASRACSIIGAFIGNNMSACTCEHV